MFHEGLDTGKEKLTPIGFEELSSHEQLIAFAMTVQLSSKNSRAKKPSKPI